MENHLLLPISPSPPNVSPALLIRQIAIGQPTDVSVCYPIVHAFSLVNAKKISYSQRQAGIIHCLLHAYN